MDEVGWALTPEPVLVLGETRNTPLPFFASIAAVLSSPDGAWLVGDRGLNEIVRMRSDGTFIGSFGRSGSGPGEFRSIGNVWLEGGGERIIVFDPDQQRLTEFDTSGHLLADVRLQSAPRTISGMGRFADGRRYGRTGDELVAAPVGGTARDTVVVYPIGTDGAVGAALARVEGPISTHFMVDGVPGASHAMHSPVPGIAVLRNCLLLTPGDTPYLTVVDSDGTLVAQHHLPLKPVATSGEHRRLWAEQMMPRAQTREDTLFVRRMSQRISLSPLFPLISEILVDELDYIWVLLHDPSSGTYPVLVLDGSGANVGRLFIPERARVQAITRSYLILSAASARGEPVLKFYGIDRQGATPAAVPQACM